MICDHYKVFSIEKNTTFLKCPHKRMGFSQSERNGVPHQTRLGWRNRQPYVSHHFVSGSVLALDPIGPESIVTCLSILSEIGRSFLFSFTKAVCCSGPRVLLQDHPVSLLSGCAVITRLGMNLP